MNILITGATGLLGKSLIESNSRPHKIIGVYIGKYKISDSENVRYYSVDICDKRSMDKIFSENKIGVVIHTAGVADVDFCEKHYEAAYRSNVTGTENMIELCIRANAKLVYVSTNAVFDGNNAPYKENDKVNPINKYGMMKVECEKKVSAAFKDSLIIRPILMYGWNNDRERNNLVTSLLIKLAKSEAVNMVTDIYDNPLSSHQCADAIWALLENGKHGTYHIAGKDMVNRYEYALAIAEIFGLDNTLIKPVDSSFFSQIAPRPKNTSYDTSKLEKEIGFKPLALKEGLELMKNSMVSK